MTDDQVVITREQSGSVNGKPLTGRVFVTGPHFSRDIYSSTVEPAEATVFSRAHAERLLAQGAWRTSAPRIEDAP